ncbi:MAG TPA: TIGR02996 domain-containing protein [Kofleriaceae bacterium]|jgi:uncharacterized protein (TIGR02996 family)
MGLIDWLRGNRETSEDKKARWLRDKIADAARANDALVLAEACAGLSGRGALVFGMVNSDFPGRADVLDEVLAALRALVPKVPMDSCERLFELVASAQLPIDVTERRARYDTERRERADRVAGELRRVIAAAGPCELARAYTQLVARATFVLGVKIDRLDPARDILRDEVLARVLEVLPKLSDNNARIVIAEIRTPRIPIEVIARTAEIAARRSAEIDGAIARAESSEPRNLALERAIDDHPDDPAAYSVLADWLVECDHPRGALIALQLRAETDPSLAGDVATHIEAHAGALLGTLSPHRRTLDGADAFIWRRGFIERARLSCPDTLARPIPLVELAQLMFGHPSARRLRALDLGMNGTPDEAALDDVIALLVQLRPRLRELRLGDVPIKECEISWYRVGNLAPLWSALRELRSLFVRGGEFALGDIVHDGLERLEVQTGGLSPSDARAIAEAKLPKLAFLDVWYGDPSYGGDATIDEVRLLLARTDWPALAHLGLKNAAFTDEICAALPGSPLAAQLRELDLSLGTMGSEGARALAARCAAFPNLARLDVSKNYLSWEAIEDLRAAFPTVIADQQRESDDDDARYPVVGE